MEFRLTYEGQVKAAKDGKPRPKEKHEIRCALHPQLKEYWGVHPSLRQIREELPNQIEEVANLFRRCDHRFLPLVTEARSAVCSLDILFLRRENPGDLILQGGDIDNRIKTLLDALRVPDTCDGVTPPAEDGSEDPFYCLLENDTLITEIKVTTDRLLKPLEEDRKQNDAMLIIKVKVMLTRLGLGHADWLV